MIRRGTTPTLVFNTSIDLTDASVLYINFKQYGKMVFEKRLAQCIVTSSSVSVDLTQEDTLKFDGEHEIQIQIRARLSDGTVVASNIMKTDAGVILKDGII